MRASVLRMFPGSVSALTLASAPALSQDASHGGGMSYELAPIIITGERQERNIFETATSVSVVTAEEIQRQVEMRSVKDVIDNAPNVFVPGSVGAGAIRGQSIEGPNSGATAFFGGTAPRATIDVDGRYLNFNELAFGDSSIWNVESIAVFRGPQTTSGGPTASPAPSS